MGERIGGTRRGRRRGIARALAVVYVLLLLEVASRAYWTATAGLPLVPERLDWWGLFFEELPESGVVGAAPAPGDATYDVLLLGGSVLHRVVEHRGPELAERLAGATGREVRLYDLARPAHTLRDSLLKYRLLADYAFDLVVVYHGINDLRMNNVPPERFRDDYTHAAWYERLERLAAAEPYLPFVTLPFTLAHARIALAERLGLLDYVPRHRPRAQWASSASQVRTAGPFASNLDALVELAAERGDSVLVASFAWYIPTNYEIQAFRRGQLDYTLRDGSGALAERHSVELWGLPDFVRRGLREHDRAIRARAEAGSVIFADAARAIPKRGGFFHDVCHLSPAGERALIDVVVEAVEANAANDSER